VARQAHGNLVMAAASSRTEVGNSYPHLQFLSSIFGRHLSAIGRGREGEPDWPAGSLSTPRRQRATRTSPNKIYLSTTLALHATVTNPKQQHDMTWFSVF